MDLEKDDLRKQHLAEITSGELIISGPAGEDGGGGAVITPGEGVVLRVNDQVIRGSRRVRAGDRVELQTLELQEPARLEVKVASDRMNAEAVYFAPREIRYLLSDQPPSPELIITASRTVEEAAPEAGLTRDQIREILRSRGVVHGLEEQALPGLIAEPGGRRTVARGQPPAQGRNGYVEPLFKEGLQQVTYDLAQAQVDYRRRYEIPQVEEGQVIARIHPPVPGQPGMTVTGAVLPPEPVHPVELRCETGVRLSADGTAAVALNSGVPLCRQRGRQAFVRVDHAYFHQGDVDIKSGHISFEGHLKIAGGIREGLQVRARGDIEVADNGSGAGITAGGSVFFRKNCIKCRVRAGSQALQMKEFGRLYNDLADQVHLALALGRELVEGLPGRDSYTEIQINNMLRSLIRKKVPDLPEQSGRVLLASRELPQEPEPPLGRVLRDCHLYLQGGGLLTLDNLQQLHEALSRNRGSWAAGDPEAQAAIISASYVQNSSLTCSGDIFVDGPGAYNSHFECGGEVHVSRVFRGGSIRAEGDIYIGEAGIPRLTEVQGLIETGGGGRVHLGRVYENTRIRLGKLEFCLEEDRDNVRVYQGQDGDIRIGSWKMQSSP